MTRRVFLIFGIATAVLMLLAASAAAAVNVRHCGATGDGATNDTAAFARALATGERVIVPGGVYRVSYLEIPDGSVLIGVDSASILQGRVEFGRDVLLQGVTVRSEARLEPLSVWPLSGEAPAVVPMAGNATTAVVAPSPTPAVDISAASPSAGGLSVTASAVRGLLEEPSTPTTASATDFPRAAEVLHQALHRAKLDYEATVHLGEGASARTIKADARRRVVRTTRQARVLTVKVVALNLSVQATSETDKDALSDLVSLNNLVLHADRDALRLRSQVFRKRFAVVSPRLLAATVRLVALNRAALRLRQPTTPRTVPTTTPSPTPTPKPTPTPSVTASPGPTPTPSETPSASPTATPTVSPSQTPTATPSETPTLSPTPTATPSETLTPIPTASPSATPTQTPTASPSPTASPTTTPIALSISLSASQGAIGEQITISGAGFGSARGDSRVYFGEPTNPVGVRPCTREAAAYLSWSDTQIVVSVPSMSPGLAEVAATHHPVYVEVGGLRSNRADFFIPAARVIDASTPATVSSAVLPNSVRTLQSISYPASPNRQGSKTFTTRVTYNADSGPHPAQGNWVASGTHDVLFRDCTFIATSSQMNPNDTGVVTLGSFADPGGQHDIYNITFVNCVFANNTSAGSNGEGANGVKVYHNGPGRWGDWTFADCSFGTPNTTTGSFRRMGIELVEPVGGLASYNSAAPNYLQNIRLAGCDFETMGCMAFSFAVYCRGPQRGVLIDECTFKGNAGPTAWGSSMVEFSGTGMEVRKSDFWAWRSALFSLEGDARDIGGSSLAGTACRRYFKDLACDMSHEYASGMTTDGWAYIANRDHAEYDVWENCDFNFGTPARHAAAFNYGAPENTCFHSDMSTSYIHGHRSNITTQPTRAQDYWRTWSGDCTDPASLYADNDLRWPIFGTRP